MEFQQSPDKWGWFQEDVIGSHFTSARMVPQFGVFFDGPKVMIANDQSVSGFDEVPMSLKRRKVTLVGT